MPSPRRRIGPPRGSGGGKERTVTPPNPDELIPSQRLRRDRIVQQAYDFLQHHEYEEIQMRDVADHAQVALGTVYRYFSSKEHLFAAVLVRWGDSLQGRVGREPLKGTDVPARLVDVYDRIIDAFERLPQFFRLMVVIETTTDPYARELFEEFIQAARSSMGEPLESLDPDEASAVADVLMAVINSALRAWAAGRISADGARDGIRRTIQLIFSPPPEPITN